jgi:hypothetical protein
MELTSEQIEIAQHLYLHHYGYSLSDVVRAAIPGKYLTRLIRDKDCAIKMDEISPGFFSRLIGEQSFGRVIAFVPIDCLPEAFFVLGELEKKLIEEDNKLVNWKTIFKGKRRTTAELNDLNKKRLLADKRENDRWEQRQLKSLEEFERKLLKANITSSLDKLTSAAPDRHSAADFR